MPPHEFLTPTLCKGGFPATCVEAVAGVIVAVAVGSSIVVVEVVVVAAVAAVA